MLQVLYEQKQEGTSPKGAPLTRATGTHMDYLITPPRRMFGMTCPDICDEKTLSLNH